MTFRNGYVPAEELRYIPWSRHRVIAWALPGLIALNEAFHEEFGTNIYITDGYRSYAEQVAVKNKKGKLAAFPGTSVHGLGQACDLGSGINSFSTRQHKWTRANAPRYGWNLPTWARPTGSKPEPWHWEAFERYIPPRSPSAPPSLPPELEPIKEALMTGPARILGPDGRKHFVDISTGAFVLIPNTEYDGVLGDRFGGETLPVSHRQTDVLADFAGRVRDNLRNG